MGEELFKIKHCNPGDEIFKEGELGDTAYSLQKGVIEVSISSSGQRVALAKLTPPAIFGEIAVLLKGQRRTATATALTGCEIVEITKDAFISVLDKTDPVIQAVLNSAIERLQKTTEKLSLIPDPCTAVCEILNLLATHCDCDVEYFAAMKAVSSALRIESGSIEKEFKRLEELKLVEFKSNESGKKVICLRHKESFLDTARTRLEELR